MSTNFQYATGNGTGFSNFREDDTVRPTSAVTNTAAPSSGGFLKGFDIKGAASNFLSSFTNNLGANLGTPKTGMAGDVKAVCGNKPINLGPLNKGKRDAYETCAQSYASQVLAAQTAAANAATAAANAPKGLSTGAMVGIIGGGLLLTGAVIWLAIRK